jgi:enoyl-CoA hydratase
MEKSDGVRWEKRGYTAIIYLDNPKTLNAMSLQDVLTLNEIAGICQQDKDLRGVILTGGGEKSFTSGGNLKTELEFSRNSPQQIREYNEKGIELVKKIMLHRLPFVAAVNGYAFGAAIALIAACDFALASENAVFGMPTTALGGIPGWGCTQIVSKAIGSRNAKRMLLLDEHFDAQEAYRTGLIYKVVKKDVLLKEAEQLIDKIAKYAGNAIYMAKALANRSGYSGFNESFADENAVLNECNTVYNFQEGIEAFLQKRPAKFK